MTDRRELGGWLALLAATGLALYLCWQMLQPFLDVLLWAMVLAIAFRPLQVHLVQRTGRPVLSAFLSCVVVVVVLVLPFAFLLLILANELSGLTKTLPADAAKFFAADAPWLQRVQPWIDPYVKFDLLRSQQFYDDRLKEILATLSGWTLGLLGNLIEALVKVLLVLFTLFYLFLDGPQLVEALRRQLPLDPEQSEAIVRRTCEVIDASLYGVLAIAMIQGTLGGLTFWALGVPSPALWGLVMTITALIPLIGTPVVWIPVAIYLFVMDQWVKAVILLAFGGLVISQIDNFLRPRLVGRRARLHALVIFFAVLGGLRLFGFLGLFLGPVIVAITQALLDVLRLGQPFLAAADGAPITADSSTDQAPVAQDPGAEKEVKKVTS
jgi:predicted PurR-regulated permease PerM